MKADIPWELLLQVFTNNATENEKDTVNAWINEVPENEIIFQQLKRYFSETGSLPLHYSPDADKAYKMWINRSNSGHKKQIKHIFNHSTWWKVAALFLVAFMGWWLINRFSPTLQNRITCFNTADTVQTNVVLPDGTHVWLNYGSELKCPKSFGVKREVFLKGEAYFEVAHDSIHPVIVNTSNTQTRVIGTQFNIKAYDTGANDIISVNEGKVSYGTSMQKVILIAGDCGNYNIENNVLNKFRNINPNYLSWKTKEFVFEREKLENVFSLLSSVYRFEYNIPDSSVKNLLLTGKFSNRPLSEIILTVEETLNLNIKYSKGKYFFKRR